MDKKAIVASIGLLIVGMAAPVNAYHTNTTGWAAPIGPFVGCEDAVAPGSPGLGGLCFLDDAPVVLAAAGACVPAGMAAPAEGAWSSATMGPGSPPAFFRVGSNLNGLDVLGAGTFYYRSLLAFWPTCGHVTIFLAVAPGAGPVGAGTAAPGAAAPAGDADAAVDFRCNDLDDGEPVLDGDAVNVRDLNGADAVDGGQTVCTPDF